MTEHEIDPRIKLFIQRLEKLDPGQRATLKRNAGTPLAESHEALGMFYSLLPAGAPQQLEELYFLVATLFPLAEGGASGDLGDALRQARSSKNQKGLDRRVEVLLDADEVQVAFRLRAAIHFLQSNRVQVNWYRLLEDLLRWTHPSRIVQERWARSYFKLQLGAKPS